MFHYFSKGVLDGQTGPGVGRFPVLSAISDYGYLGVNFFFIISGFVIFFSALGRTPGQFASARVVRLYPAFLFCMTLTALVTTVVGTRSISAFEYLVNLTMLPAVLGVEPVDGVYWTLAPEIFFYVMIFFAMLAGALKYPRALVAVAVLVTSASVFSGIMVPYFDGFAPLFAGGCALALFYRNPRDWLVLGLSMIAAVTSVISTYQYAETMMDRFPDLSPTIAATIVAVMFAAFLLFRTRDVKNGERAQAFGALTYPLYLLHSQIGFAIMMLVQTEANKWVVTPLVAGLMTLLAWFVAVQIEARYRVTWKLLADRMINRPIATILRVRAS